MATMYRELLTADERKACWRLGALAKFAEAGVRVGDIDKAVKVAGIPASAATLLSPVGMAKAVATVAVLTGVPLGVAAHVVGRRMSQARGKEKEMTEQAQFYRNATAQLEQGLSQ